MLTNAFTEPRLSKNWRLTFLQQFLHSVVCQKLVAEVTHFLAPRGGKLAAALLSRAAVGAHLGTCVPAGTGRSTGVSCHYLVDGKCFCAGGGGAGEGKSITIFSE